VAVGNYELLVSPFTGR